MVSKSVLTVIAIVAILVIGGGIYMTQQPPSTPVSTPPPTTPEPAATTTTEAIAPTETPTQTTPTPTETPEETLPGLTLPAGSDEEQIEALMIAYCERFNKYSAEEVAACFTNEATRTSIVPAFGTRIGREEIKKGFEEKYTQYPSMNREDLDIQSLEVNGDRASVQIHYMVSIASSGYKEILTVVRVDDTWRIQKAYSTYAD